MSTPTPERRMWYALAAVTVVALALRTWGLSAQPLITDDTLAGATARNFVESGWPGPTMWHHPRLRDHLVYLSSWALGGGPWGLKAWSVLLGTLSVTATGYLVWLVSGSRMAAMLSAAIVATDPLHVDFSRQAINDVYLSFFPIAAIVALLVYAERRRPGHLVVAGILLALGLASKWNIVFTFGAAVALTLPAVFAAAGTRRERGAEIALTGAALVLLPAALYVLSYWPWFGRGHDLLEFARFHQAMAFEATTHAGYAGTRLAGYPGDLVGAWRWFLQPVWWVDYVRPGAPLGGIPRGGLFLPGIGNPVTWLATLPAAGWAAWRWLRARDRAAGFLLVLWLAAYLPFVVVPRPIWANSAVTVVPFWAALVGLAAARLWEPARPPVAAWAAAAVIFGLLLWVPATGRRFGPSDALVRALVSPLALDPAYHPAPSIYGVDVGP